MNALFDLVPPDLFVVTCAIALLAGAIKGMVGFAMPMIMISAFSSIMAPELALAGLIVPTLVTNGMQAFRQGVGAAFHSVRQFRVFLMVGLFAILTSAQFVRFLPADVLLLAIAVPVAFFASIQLLGVRLRIKSHSHRLDALVGAISGAIGGFSGVWGPPVVLYLTALETEKTSQMRIQGVIYGLGAMALFGAHIGSGILNLQTLVFSSALVPAAVVGMWLGGKLQDKVDQEGFRNVTLIVLFVAAMNLIRRAVM